jgi:hypothetical protein
VIGVLAVSQDPIRVVGNEVVHGWQYKGKTVKKSQAIVYLALSQAETAKKTGFLGWKPAVFGRKIHETAKISSHHNRLSDKRVL